MSVDFVTSVGTRMVLVMMKINVVTNKWSVNIKKQCRTILIKKNKKLIRYLYLVGNNQT